jgi:hypothetical protein
MSNPLTLELRNHKERPVVNSLIQIEVVDEAEMIRLEAYTDARGQVLFQANVDRSSGGLTVFVSGKKLGPYRDRGRPYDVVANRSDWILSIRTIGPSEDQKPGAVIDLSET